MEVIFLLFQDRMRANEEVTRTRSVATAISQRLDLCGCGGYHSIGWLVTRCRCVEMSDGCVVSKSV